jgi:putative membrane protein
MFIKNLIYGIIIGIGFIIPGVSGGVIATILGIYEIIINKINNIFNDFKNNIIYLLPILIGVILSIFLFSKIILYLINNKLIFISYVFIGLILGCIPFLIKEIKNKTNKSISFIPFLISLIVGIILFIVQKNNIPTSNNPSLFQIIIGGILYSFGKIVPGISSTSLLIFIGIYNYLLNTIANPSISNLLFLIPFIISFLISSVIILKLIEYLLNNYFRYTYSSIIGFVISSILFIYPNTISIYYLLVCILSFIISNSLSN